MALTAEQRIKEAGDLARRSNVQFVFAVGALLLIALAVDSQYRGSAVTLDGHHVASVPAEPEPQRADPASAIERLGREAAAHGCIGEAGAGAKPPGMALCLRLFFAAKAEMEAARMRAARVNCRLRDARKLAIVPAGDPCDAALEVFDEAPQFANGKEAREYIARAEPVLDQQRALEGSASDLAARLHKRLAETVDFSVTSSFKAPVPLQYAPMGWLVFAEFMLLVLMFKRARFWSLIASALEIRKTRRWSKTGAEMVEMPFWLAPAPLVELIGESRDQDPAQLIGWQRHGRERVVIMWALAAFAMLLTLRMAWIGSQMSSFEMLASASASRAGGQIALAATLALTGAILATLLLIVRPPGGSGWAGPALPERRSFLLAASASMVVAVTLGQGLVEKVLGLTPRLGPRVRLPRSPRVLHLPGSNLEPGFYAHRRTGAVHYLTADRQFRSMTPEMDTRSLIHVSLADVLTGAPLPRAGGREGVKTRLASLTPEDAERAALDLWSANRAGEAGRFLRAMIAARWAAFPSAARVLSLADLAAGIAIREQSDNDLLLLAQWVRGLGVEQSFAFRLSRWLDPAHAAWRGKRWSHRHPLRWGGRAWRKLG